MYACRKSDNIRLCACLRQAHRFTCSYSYIYKHRFIAIDINRDAKLSSYIECLLLARLFSALEMMKLRSIQKGR